MKILVENGTITANRAVLNTICCFTGEAVQHYQALGLNALAREADEFRRTIFEALEKSGYYKNCLNTMED